MFEFIVTIHEKPGFVPDEMVIPASDHDRNSKRLTISFTVIVLALP
jgi:hypothetical protein